MSPSRQPCPDDCRCGKHRSQLGRAGRECQPGCPCRRHNRTPEHNTRIGMGVAITAEAKRR